MKKIAFLFFYFQFIVVFAQFNPSAPWMDNVAKNQNGEASLNDIKMAFESYWAERDYKKKGSGYKPFMRWETHWQNKVNENGFLLTPEQMWQAWNQKKQSQMMRSAQDVESNWEPLGPFNHVNTGSWSSGQGRVNVIVVDPNNSNTIYIGTPAGGIWKSTNAGMNWTPLSDYLPQIGVSGIVIDHTNSDVIYIATGDKDANDTYSVGVMKSTDGGITWNTTGLTFTNTSTVAADMFMHPTNPNILWVATSAGLYKTSNAGVSWTKTLNGNVKDVKLKPGNPDIVYAVTTNRFHRSTNGGDSFTQITSGMPSNSGRLIIDVTPANPEYVYVLSARTNWSHQGLYKSVNSGLNFTKTDNNTDIFEANQAWFTLALAVSDTNPEEVYTGVLNVWKSTNGGNSFVKINNWSNPFQATYTHADIHFLRFYNGVLYCGSDGGIYVSSNNGESFTDLTATAQIGQFYKISVSKQTSSKIAGGLQDNGGYALSSNLWKNFYGADGMETAIDPTNSNKYYGFIQNGGGLYYSNNAGSNLSGSVDAPEGQEGNWVTPLVINSSGELFSGYTGVYKLVNNAWMLLSTNNFSSGNIDKMMIDPTNDDIMYVGDGNDLYKSIDRGVSFSLLYSFSSAITGMAVNNNNNSILYVTTSGLTGGVFKSVDGGQGFSAFHQGLPNIGRNVIVHQPNHPDDPVYIGTSLGVYYRDNTLSSWIPFDTNLPNVSVTDLEIHPLDGKIIASTYGRGVWQSTIPEAVVPNEIALLGVATPSLEVINCGGSDLTFLVRNLGTESISSFQIDYTVNGQDFNYIWNGTLQPNETIQVVVTNENWIRGNTTINANVIFANDTFSNNNSVSITFLNNDSGTVGEVNTFETEDSYLLTSQEGSSTLWQRGVPSGTLLNTTTSGTNVYGTNLNGNYTDNTQAFLYSQCYNLTEIINPVMKFKMAYDLETNWDILYVQYSTDLGENWTVLGSANDSNWYNSSQNNQNGNNCFNCPGAQWTGTNATLSEYSYVLDQFSSASNIMFRFVFHSDESVNQEGVIIDDFVIEGTLSTVDNAIQKVVVFPNPTSGEITVYLDQNEPKEIEIYDISGKLIHTQNQFFIQDRQLKLNLEKYAQGIYFVKIKTENQQFTQRIIKK